MATELNFSLDKVPGGLASITEVLGKAGINIDGGAGVRIGGKGLVTVVTSKSEEAKRVLKAAKIDYEEEEVLFVCMRDKPGALAEFTKRLAEKSVNVTSFYITMTGQQVIGADNLEKAKEVAQSMGILVAHD